ncbi:MAG: hypothetical protein VW580_06720, partial [Flavobacteriaceae bacterium]
YSIFNDFTLLCLLMNRVIFILLIFVLSSTESFAQCSMLSAIMETDQQYEAAKGLNRGIVYLMSIPYILVGLIIWKIYRTNKAPN